MKRSMVSSISKRERSVKQIKIPQRNKLRFNKCKLKKRSKRRSKNRLLKSGIKLHPLRAANLLFLPMMNNQKALRSNKLVALNQKLIKISRI